MRCFMKKILVVILALVMIFACSCGAKPAANEDSPLNDMAVTDILAYLYDNTDLELPELMGMELTTADQEYFLGTTDLEFTEALVSEPMIGSIPYSVCLVRFEDAKAAAEGAEKIAKSVNPRKWVCVEVPADKVITTSSGNVAALFMTEHSAALNEAFTKLAESK